MTEKSDIVILGAGPAGYIGALSAAALGASVTLVEKDRVGGTCLHRGCIPTKTLLATAHLAIKLSKSETYAIKLRDFEVDFGALMKRKNDVVSRLEKGILALLNKRKINLLNGTGKVVAPNRIEVKSDSGTTSVEAGKGLIIATGSKPAILPGVPFDGDKIITSNEALSLQRPPKSICIVGAGVIGFEMAELFWALGTEVTLVEALPGILPLLDTDIGKEAARLLKRRKIAAHTGTTAEAFDTSGSTVKVALANGKVVESEKVLLVTGRKPNTENIGIKEKGLFGPAGFMAVDEVGRTCIEKLYAVGDVAGRLMLAHFASAQCVAAVKDTLGEESKLDPNAVPGVVYSKPEIASVGLTEKQAAETGLAYKTARFDNRSLGRAQAEDELIGFAKIIGEERSGRILGMHIMAHGAGEMIHEAAFAIRMKLTVADLAETVHAHPSFSESIEEAAHLWLNHPRHA
ncbi:MAG: dihydrolipoyl dehydrogenase [Planctomycetota bacterium]